jgi:hypothetical protein
MCVVAWELNHDGQVSYWHDAKLLCLCYSHSFAARLECSKLRAVSRRLSTEHIKPEVDKRPISLLSWDAAKAE